MEESKKGGSQLPNKNEPTQYVPHQNPNFSPIMICIEEKLLGNCGKQSHRGLSLAQLWNKSV